ncbi:MAG: type II toxin-antitoxin system YafQ family toxin [Prevotellaceae bacterium]|jgi:mRNA interferase YafQ|nr:type II toxin-antitoxin system YafQ family toxin [Prevotellaceae bacterium]
MYEIKYSTKFKKDYKLLAKRHLDICLLRDVITKLVAAEPLPIACKDHKLQGEFADCRECHIKPDWLLIYKVNTDENLLELVATGTHNDLF